MTGHRKWSEIRNPVMDEPLQRHRRTELRRANDVALELGRLRDQRSSVGLPEANALPISETEYLAALRQSIEDLGGRLEIAAVFPDQRVTLAPASCIDDETVEEQP